MTRLYESEFYLLTPTQTGPNSQISIFVRDGIPSDADCNSTRVGVVVVVVVVVVVNFKMG